MESWEFLLQKEGDREWLSLESAQVEVLEGCYRLMARCPYPDSSIDVEINHYVDQAGLTKHRQQRRTHRASSSGLLGIIPFTYLEPGLWELNCVLQQTILKSSAPVQLTLEVLPQSVDPNWDFDPELPRAAEAKLTNPIVPGASDPIPQKSPVAPIGAEVNQVPGPSLTPLLVLDQAAHTVFADESVVLSGQVWASGELTIRLRNPLTQEITFEQQVSIPQAPPQRFSVALTVPQANCVLVGEARLLPTASEPSSRLRSSQAFMITVLLPPEAELLAQIGAGAVALTPPLEQPEKELEFSMEPKPQPILTTLPEPTVAPARRINPPPQLPQLAPVALATVPSPGLVIPPRLKTSPSHSKGLQRIHLPEFGLVTTPTPSRPEIQELPPPSRPRSFSSLKRQTRFFSTLTRLAEEGGPVMAPEKPATIPSPPTLKPLPAPILTLPQTSLQAGTLFSLHLNLPDYHPGIGVKLWVTNAETGDLIAGPRWLTDFRPLPDQSGATTQLDLAIPAMVKVMALMAIAVDEQTGQESPTVVMRQALNPAPETPNNH